VFSGLRGDDVVVYAVENQTKIVVRIGPLARTLVEQYRAEKMPKPYSTRRSYDSWLDNHILPKWGENPITDLQARPVELWQESLMLSSRSKSSIRGLLGALLDYAMWRGDLPVQRNPMELVAVKNATKRTRQPHSLTVEDFQKFLQHLGRTLPHDLLGLRVLWIEDQ
jgi:integrase